MLAVSNTPCRGAESMEASNCLDEGQALPLKMIAIVSILFAGILGVGFPLIGNKRKFLAIDSDIFLIFKSFAAGVILATGFVHMLPDGEQALMDPCLPKFPWSNFPFSGFIAMMASLVTLLADYLGTLFYTEKHKKEQKMKRAVDSGNDRPVAADDDMIIVTVRPTDEDPNSVPVLEQNPGDHACHSSHIRNVVVSQVPFLLLNHICFTQFS